MTPTGRNTTSNNSSNQRQTISSFCFAITTATFIVSFGKLLTEHYLFITVAFLSLLVVLLHVYRTRHTRHLFSSLRHLHSQNNNSISGRRNNNNSTIMASRPLMQIKRNKGSPFNRRTVRLKPRVSTIERPSQQTASQMTAAMHDWLEKIVKVSQTSPCGFFFVSVNREQARWNPRTK